MVKYHRTNQKIIERLQVQVIMHCIYGNPPGDAEMKFLQVRGIDKQEKRENYEDLY